MHPTSAHAKVDDLDIAPERPCCDQLLKSIEGNALNGGGVAPKVLRHHARVSASMVYMAT